MKIDQRNKIKFFVMINYSVEKNLYQIIMIKISLKAHMFI